MAIRVGLVLGAAAFHCAFCVLQVSAENSDPISVTEEIAFVGRALNRAGMIFPLLLGISARLAALVPSVFLGVIGIFVFVAFSKKAFIISLLALLLSYLDKKRNRPKIFHIHQGGHHHSDLGAIEFEPSYHHHHHHPHKFLDFHKKPFRKWPKIDHGPWTTAGPGLESTLDSYLPHSMRRTNLYQNPYILSPQSAYYPRFSHLNATEPSFSSNYNSEISPDIQQFIDKTLNSDEEDPR